MSALEDVSLKEDGVVRTSPEEVSSENGAVKGEEYETVQLEAYESQVVTAKKEERETAEAWTTYEIGKETENTHVAVPQSPAVSEITPVEGEESVSFPTSSAPIQINVSNPKKAEEVSKIGIRTTFTSYLVQSETTLADYPFTKRSVWRRFKDFDMLHRLLRENHRGFIVPALPSKNFFESRRGKDTFIKERQMELNKFLTQVALHKNLHNSEEMKIFLGYPEDLSASHAWYKLIESAKQLAETPINEEATDLDKPAETMKKDLTSVLKKVGKTIKLDVLPRSYAISDTERSLQDMVPHLKQLELHLGGAVDKSQSFLALFGGVGNEVGLLGRIWLAIARFEEEFVEATGQYSATGRAVVQEITSLHKSGCAAVRVQHICNKSSELLKARLGTLTDHLNILPSVLLSLQDRTLVLRHLHEAQYQLEASRKALDNLARDSGKKLGGTTGFANKSGVLSQEIRTYVDVVNKRTEMYDTVTQRNVTELKRQTEERKVDLCELALGIAKLQQEYYETVSLVWVNLAEEISRMLPPEDIDT